MSESHKNVSCPVDDPTDLFGVFANAIRLRSDGPDVLVDFCVYSSTENRARVVSRIRVQRSFLPTIQEKIANAVPGLVREEAILVMPLLGET